MKRIDSFSNLIPFFLIFVLIGFVSLCKKAIQREVSIADAEIEVEKIEARTGIKFKILKTESIGYMPLHKFYWCCLHKKVGDQKVKELAHEIIKETIVKRLKNYHSFTIHFFLEGELKEIPEESACYARATYLPEGSWIKVGRVPIDDYEIYKLNCTFFDEENFP